MNAVCHVFLTRSAGSDNQYRHRGRCYQGSQSVEFSCRSRTSFNSWSRSRSLRCTTLVSSFPCCVQRNGSRRRNCCRPGRARLFPFSRDGWGSNTCRSRFECLLYFFQQDVRLHRFADVVRRSELHRRHRVLHFGITGHDDKGYLSSLFTKPLQQAESVLVGQTQVRQDQLRRFFFVKEAFDGGLHRRGSRYLKTFFAQPSTEQGRKG